MGRGVNAKIQIKGQDFELREAGTDEYTAVGEMLVDAFTHGCWITPAYRKRLTSITEWAATSHVWVITRDDELQAAVLTPQPELHKDESFTFNVLGVAQSGRGFGLGNVLVEHCIALADEHGYRTIELHSSPHMTHAHNLYYRHGFHRRIDWETMVIDSGQRLLTFTRNESWRGSTAMARAKLAEHQPASAANPVVATEPATKEPRIFLPSSQPGSSSHDPARLRAQVSAGTEVTLDASALDPRAWASVAAVRLRHLPIEVRHAPATENLPDVALAVDGTVLSTNWREISAALWGGEAESHLVNTIDSDLIEALFGVIDTSVDAARRDALRRVFYARLGLLDQELSAQMYLGGEELNEADSHLFGVLLTFDIGYRSAFPFADAAVVDYPNLWRFARDVFNNSAIVTQAEAVKIGLLPNPDGDYADPWGPPAFTETVDDLRTAWLQE